MSKSFSGCGRDYELWLGKTAAANILGDAWKVPKPGYETDVRVVRVAGADSQVARSVVHHLILGNFGGKLVLYSPTTPRSQWAEAFNVEGAV